MEEYEKTYKSIQVKNHLLKEGHIDSWTAISLYGATRLSAIIYNLRRRGYDIASEPKKTKDRNNNLCIFVNYILVNKPQD